jgi:acyl-CoA thioesterase II
VTKFDEDTAVRRVDDDLFVASISPDWWVFTGPNGGYLASVVMQALTARVSDPARAARSLTIHYLRPPAEGEVTIEARVVRAGKSLSTLSARMTQDGAEIAVALAAFSQPREALSFHDATMPAVTAPEDTRPSVFGDEMKPPIAHRFDYRPITNEAIFVGGETAEVAAWVRLREPRPLDPVLLATISDALVPAVFPKASAPLAAITVDLTVHFRAPVADPAYDGWCLARFRSRVAADGFIEEDGDMYRPDGVLIAQSRQLAALVPLG